LCAFSLLCMLFSRSSLCMCVWVGVWVVPL
jgi:hypothetical protein